MKSLGWKIVLIGLVALATSCARAEKVTLRVGYFPNITHAAGMIGSHGTREKSGWFEQQLGPDVTVQWFPFNAGPSAMEAIFAGSIDLTYAGPNPVLNAHIRSRGEEIRILAGATFGGAALVVSSDGRITGAADFKGRRMGSPQLGNTQDVAARAWLTKQGFKITLTGGDVHVLPTPNPDQLSLFQQGQLDGVWTVEPWVSRLEMEAKGRVLIEQPEAVTTVLVASAKILKTRPELVAQFRAAHLGLTAWINAHPEEAREKVRTALSTEMRRPISGELMARAWSRLRFSGEVTQAQFDALVTEARSVGFLRNAIPLDRLFLAQP